jgi:hypothetical protein
LAYITQVIRRLRHTSGSRSNPVAAAAPQLFSRYNIVATMKFRATALVGFDDSRSCESATSLETSIHQSMPDETTAKTSVVAPLLPVASSLMSDGSTFSAAATTVSIGNPLQFSKTSATQTDTLLFPKLCFDLFSFPSHISI